MHSKQLQAKLVVAYSKKKMECRLEKHCLHSKKCNDPCMTSWWSMSFLSQPVPLLTAETFKAWYREWSWLDPVNLSVTDGQKMPSLDHSVCEHKKNFVLLWWQHNVCGDVSNDHNHRWRWTLYHSLLISDKLALFMATLASTKRTMWSMLYHMSLCSISLRRFRI